jgi:hypothetical protein
MPLFAIPTFLTPRFASCQELQPLLYVNDVAENAAYASIRHCLPSKVLQGFILAWHWENGCLKLFLALKE